VIETSRDPLDYGLPRCSPDALAGGDAKFNANALETVLNGEDRGPHCDALLLGAGLALELSGRARDLHEGIEQARAAIDSGAANGVLNRLRVFAAQ